MALTSYLHPVFGRDMLRKTADRTYKAAKKLCKQYPFDTIAFCGISGSAMAFILAYQMMFVWSKIPEWVVALSVLSGLLLGVLFSYIISLSPFRKFTHNMRFSPVLFFSFLLVAMVIVTKRLIGL